MPTTRLLPLFLLLVAANVPAANAPAAKALPRVLILGDNSYNGPASEVAKELKGRAQTVWKDPGDSGSALQRIEELLGKEKWDVIHFNFGPGDLVYKDPSTKVVRAMSKRAGGVRATTPEQYEKNLKALIERFRATGAKLVWASTTPVASLKIDNIMDPGSEVEYNAIAAKVMDEAKVPVNDMHAFVLANSATNDKKKAPNPVKEVPFHEPLLRQFLSILNLQASDK